jgi:hypothetical protein
VTIRSMALGGATALLRSLARSLAVQDSSACDVAPVPDELRHADDIVRSVFRRRVHRRACGLRNWLACSCNQFNCCFCAIWLVVEMC